MTQSVGFIGLGAMGHEMARLLAESGRSVTAYDADGDARQRAAALPGIAAAATAAEVAGAVDVLFTCLPNDAVVRAVYLDGGGVAEHVRQGLISLDCSTVSPGVTRDVAGALRSRGASHLDASMLGSVPQAKTGTIGFVVGGERAAFDAVLPLLDVLGRMVTYVGPSGTANQVKLIHQTLVAGHAAAVAEALSLCIASGTDLDVFYDIVCNGGGFAYSRYFEQRTPRMRDGEFSPLFMLDLMAKDAGLAQELARTVGAPTPVLDAVLDVFRAAQQDGSGREDFSAVAHRYEKAIGAAFKDH